MCWRNSRSLFLPKRWAESSLQNFKTYKRNSGQKLSVNDQRSWFLKFRNEFPAHRLSYINDDRAMKPIKVLFYFFLNSKARNSKRIEIISWKIVIINFFRFSKNFRCVLYSVTPSFCDQGWQNIYWKWFLSFKTWTCGT